MYRNENMRNSSHDHHSFTSTNLESAQGQDVVHVKVILYKTFTSIVTYKRTSAGFSIYVISKNSNPSIKVALNGENLPLFYPL